MLNGEDIQIILIHGLIKILLCNKTFMRNHNIKFKKCLYMSLIYSNDMKKIT